MASQAKFLDSIAHNVAPNFDAPHPDAKGFVVVATSGATTALNSGDAIFSFRTPPSGFCRVTTVRALGLHTTGFASNGNGTLDLVIARGFTVSDSGGSALTPFGVSQGALRTGEQSLVTDFRVANTAALTPGTRTLDAQSNTSLPISYSTSATATALNLSSLINPWSETTSPAFSLVANEGFIIRIGTANYPATGTIVWKIIVGWDELPSW